MAPNNEVVSRELTALATAASQLAKRVSGAADLPGITLAETMVRTRKLQEAIAEMGKRVANANGDGRKG